MLPQPLSKQEQTPYSLSRIRNPAALASESNAELQCVWRLSDTGLLRAEVEDLETACEAALEIANASLPTLEDMGGDIAGMQLRWGGAALAGWAGCDVGQVQLSDEVAH